MRVLAFALLLAAGPAGAGCFTAEEMPGRVIYGGGATLHYLEREGDVLTYRSGEVTSRMKGGIWPLEHRSSSFNVDYSWKDPLPTLPEIVAAGGKARAEGQKTESGKAPQKVAIEAEVLDSRTLDWEDCRYDVIEFRKTLWVDGKKISEGVVVYAPGAMISFRSDSTEPASGASYSYELTTLE